MLRLVTVLLLSTAAFVFAEEDEPTYVIRRTRQAPVQPVESSKLVFLSSVDHVPNSEANKRLVQRQAGPGYQTPPNGVPLNEYSPNSGAPPPNAGSSPVQGSVAQFNNGGQQGELTSGVGSEDQAGASGASGAAGAGGSGSGAAGLGSNQSGGGGSESGSGAAGSTGGGSGSGGGVSGAGEAGSGAGGASGSGGAGGGASGGASGGSGAGGGSEGESGASGAGDGASGAGGSSGGAAPISTGAAPDKPAGPFHGDAASLGKGDYSFGERQSLPPGCFINESGFVCCNRMLNDALMASVKRISSDPKYSKCAIQKLVNTLHKDMETGFKMDLKSLVGLQDYAQRVRFRGNMICKVEAGERFIISYAGPGPLTRRKRDSGFANETAIFGDLDKITSMLF